MNVRQSPEWGGDSSRGQPFRLHLTGRQVALGGIGGSRAPIRLLRGTGTPLIHHHDFIELVFVARGSGLHLVSGRRFPVYAGDCFVVHPGERHHFEQARGLQNVNILFYPAVLDPYAEALRAMPGFRRLFVVEPLFRHESSAADKVHLDVGRRRTMDDLCTRLAAELDNKDPGADVAAAALFLETVVFLSRCADQPAGRSPASSAYTRQEHLAAQAISFLESNLEGDLQVADVARYVCIGDSRLGRVFREQTGMTISAFLTRLRIDQACAKLKSSDDAVAEIGYDVGYREPSYFTRVFRKTVGMTPEEFRRKARER